MRSLHLPHLRSFRTRSARTIERRRRRSRLPIAVFAGLMAMLSLAGCSFSFAEDVTPPPNLETRVQAESQVETRIENPLPLAPPDVERGAAIYAESCAPCHGLTGLGDGPQANQLPNPVAPIGAPDLARTAAPMTWFRTVTDGNLDRFMPPFSNLLTVQQRWDVLAYVYTLSDPADRLALGKSIYENECADCHGEAGRGDGAEAGQLSVKPSDLTDLALMAERSANEIYEMITAGIEPDMPDFADALSDGERWALTAYLRTLAFANPEAKIVVEPGQESAAPELEAGSEGSGLVTGAVADGSGRALPEDLVVTLHAFDGQSEVLRQSTPVQADGSFFFEDVEMPPDRAFFVTIEYGGNTFASDTALAQDGLRTLHLPVTVYESTTDSSMLVVDRLHIFLEHRPPDLLNVTQLYLISNSGNRIIVAAEPNEPVLTFHLPEGAVNLQVDEGVLGARMIPMPDGFGLTGGVPPGTGQYQVLFSYDMPFRRRLDIEQPLNLPVNAVVVLMPESGIKVKSDLLEDMGIRVFQGQDYHIYTSDVDLRPGNVLPISLTGESASLLYSESTMSVVMGSAAAGFALLFAGFWLYRRRSARALKPVLGRSFGDSREEAEMIMDAIIALDDLYRSGKLPETAYRERRADLKVRLRERLEG